MRNYQIMRYLLIVCWIIGNMPSGWAAEGGSTYTQRPDDPEAFYFTPENYGFKADGKSDVTDALQEAINQVKREKNFGILFLPEGNYRISKTIQIPSSIRLIGYGKIREGWHKRAGSLRMPVQVLSIVRCPMWISV